MTSLSIFKFYKKKFKENFFKLLNTFENIMENGAFAPKEQCSIYHNIFKYMIIQRRQKALLWSEGLNVFFTFKYGM